MTNPNCKNDADMQAFFQTFLLRAKTVQYKIDFEVYDKNPVKYIDTDLDFIQLSTS